MNVLKEIRTKDEYYGVIRRFELVDTATDCVLSSLIVNINQSFNREKSRREVVGFPSRGNIYYLNSFGTSYKYRQKGYGRQLLNFVKEKMKGKFIFLIVQSVDEDYMKNSDLVKFYQSVGFKIHEKKDAFPQHTWMVLDNRKGC